MTEFNDAEKNDYLERVYSGIITLESLDPIYHEKVGGTLFDAVKEGYQGNIDTWPDYTQKAKVLKALRKNIYVFSAAKQYQQVKIMAGMINLEGENIKWVDFKAMAGKVFDEFNINYLKAEYQTAVGQSQMAKAWVNVIENKDLFPMIEYKTQKDGRVRDAHAMLDGVVRPVNDPFWNYYMPKNGWNCRCFIVTHSKETKETEIPKDIPEWGSKEFPEIFKMNPGKDKIIFKKDHPYFEVSRSVKKRNFGLPIP